MVLPAAASRTRDGGAGRLVAAALTVAVCAALVLLTASAFSDNDQAALVGGALQLARGEVPFWDAPFYNYDKQYGAYGLLALVLRLAPEADPVLAGNLLQVVLLALALALVAGMTMRTGRPPPLVLALVLASPVLVTQGSFLGTGALSLAFLLLAFVALFRRPGSLAGRVAACLLMGLAAACRGDAVLAVPALFLAATPRRGLLDMARHPLAWGLGASAVLPVLLGKAMDANRNADFLGASFDLRVWGAYVAFGMGFGALVALVALAAAHAGLAVRKRRWAVFHLALAGAALLPLVFYSLQLSTPRYFFLALAVLLFLGASRRTAILLRAARRSWPGSVRAATIALGAVAVLPWMVGLNAPSLPEIRPTLTGATRLPSADGRLPMGAYLAFLHETVAEGFATNANQKIWLSASAASFEGCGGAVPLLGTGMVNHLELAVRLQGRAPRILAAPEESSCGYVYADARSLTRSYGGAGPGDAPGFFQRRIELAPAGPQTGQPVLKVFADGGTSDLGRLLQAMRAHFQGREFEMIFEERRTVGTGLLPARFGDPDGGPEAKEPEGCRPLAGPAEIVCAAGRLAGRAVAVFPAYTGK